MKFKQMVSVATQECCSKEEDEASVRWTVRMVTADLRSGRKTRCGPVGGIGAKRTDSGRKDTPIGRRKDAILATGVPTATGEEVRISEATWTVNGAAEAAEDATGATGERPEAIATEVRGIFSRFVHSFDC
jgi:hypothetical protein